MNMGSYKSLYYYLLIIQIITPCFNVSPKLNASDAPVREQKYYLKTFDTKITSKAIALVHSFATQNDNITDILHDPSKIYDFKDLQSFFLANALSTFRATT